MRYADALAMADNTMTYRLIVKEVAAWHGYYATFMPKPLFGENGSGMHTHMSLFKGGRNQFFDAKDPHHLSKTAKGFIAGLLVHAREMSAVLAQWVNSYKRLVPGFEAPVYVAWSQRNRSALIRIPLYKPGAEQATRAEIRCPDPACNPYLAFAALLHAGLEGIEKGYELPDEMTTNLYRLSEEEREERGIVVAARVARRGGRGARRLGADAHGARRAHLPALRRAQAARVERVPDPGDRVGEGPLPKQSLASQAGIRGSGFPPRNPRPAAGYTPEAAYFVAETRVSQDRRFRLWTSSAVWRMMRGAGRAARRAAMSVSDGRSRVPGGGPWSFCVGETMFPPRAPFSRDGGTTWFPRRPIPSGPFTGRPQLASRRGNPGFGRDGSLHGSRKGNATAARP